MVERKLATVLFVDLVGSTDLLADADPEVVRRRVGRFFDQVGKFSRIINVSSIHIKAKDAKAAADSTISAECVATTFVLLENAPEKKMGPNGRPLPTRPARPAARKAS